MAISRQDLRKLERSLQKLTGSRSQALRLRRKIEARAQQAARRATRGTTSPQAAAKTQPEIIKNLVTNKRAGWVNDPGKNQAVLVEKGTGCLVLDSKGKVITEPKHMLPSKPGINQSTFLRHLRSQGIEEYVPHMYLDDKGNVTVGIGHLVDDVDEAQRLSFKRREPIVGASPLQLRALSNV